MLAQVREETLPSCASRGVEVAEPKGLPVFSVPDIMVVSVLALLLFGPEKLPKMMRQAGRIMREVQNTSHTFIAEMERAADVDERPVPPPSPASPSSVNAHPIDDATIRPPE